MFTGRDAIRKSLLVLGEKISVSGHAPVCLLICGGSALNLSGLITRTTEDVNVWRQWTPIPAGSISRI
jgi:hypothetical protein